MQVQFTLNSLINPSHCCLHYITLSNMLPAVISTTNKNQQQYGNTKNVARYYDRVNVYEKKNYAKRKHSPICRLYIRKIQFITTKHNSFLCLFHVLSYLDNRFYKLHEFCSLFSRFNKIATHNFSLLIDFSPFVLLYISLF